MTPAEMARAFLMNIEATRALMEDGPTGYVLHTYDNMFMLCQKPGGQIFRSHPQNDAVLVFTSHGRAVTAQRWWNHHHPDEQVLVGLRREALQAYIAKQQEAHETIMNIIEFTKGS